MNYLIGCGGVGSAIAPLILLIEIAVRDHID
jgi:hypothetical protein